MKKITKIKKILNKNKRVCIEFVVYNIIFWLIILDVKIRDIVYILLTNIVNNDTFVTTIVSLITGAVSMRIGYKINKNKDNE